MSYLVSYTVDLIGWPRGFQDIVFDQPVTAKNIEAVRRALLKAARIQFPCVNRICLEDITILGISELKS